MPDQDEILTISQVAELLKIAEKTVYGLAQRGEIPAFKVGGQWRFSRAAIDSWIQASTRTARDTRGGGGSGGHDNPASGDGHIAEKGEVTPMISSFREALAADVHTETKRTMTVPEKKRDSGSRAHARLVANNEARRTTATGGAEQCGRDTGPVSTRNSSKGALVAEAYAIFREVRSGATADDLRIACFSGNILRQSARETRRRIWWALHWRYFAWNPPQWVLADLGEASAGDVTDRAFVGLAYLHYVRRDRLTFDFVTDRLWAHHHSKTPEVSRDDVLDFLATYESRESDIKKWRESTRKKLAGNVLSALRDFGVLTGVQRKSLQRPVVPPEVALHLCRLLHCEGLRGRALLEAKDWRLFFWEPHDTSLALAQLAQRGDIRFERSGRTVVLEVSEHPHGGPL